MRNFAIAFFLLQESELFHHLREEVGERGGLIQALVEFAFLKMMKG